MTEDDTHSLLRVLHWWLVQHSEMATRAATLAARGAGPTHAQALDWTAMLLDACFGSVVLSPTTGAIAADLKRLVDEQVALCEVTDSRHCFHGCRLLA